MTSRVDQRHTWLCAVQRTTLPAALLRPWPTAHSARPHHSPCGGRQAASPEPCPHVQRDLQRQERACCANLTVGRRRRAQRCGKVPARRQVGDIGGVPPRRCKQVHGNDAGCGGCGPPPGHAHTQHRDATRHGAPLRIDPQAYLAATSFKVCSSARSPLQWIASMLAAEPKHWAASRLCAVPGAAGQHMPSTCATTGLHCGRQALFDWWAD